VGSKNFMNEEALAQSGNCCVKKQTNKETNKLVTLLDLITRLRFGETVFKKEKI
jgi:hypothetical protein